MSMVPKVPMKKPFQSSPSTLPPIPVPSATVVLVRQRDDRMQVYLLQRSIKSGFMAGKYVFPGGMVDPGDMDINAWWPYIDIDAGQISRQLGHALSAQEILPYCLAGIRETFEEAGVLLMDAAQRFDPMRDHLESVRMEGPLSTHWLRESAVANDRAVSVSKLSCWSHWVTPQQMKRRFDTRFFIAAMPEGQVCSPDNGETTHGIWVTPKAGLAGNLDGTIPLSPPTLVTLHDLLAFETMDQLESEIANRDWGTPIMPRLIPLKEGAVIVEPWDPLYKEECIRINPDLLLNNTLPLGRPFSRLWYHQDIWRPIANDIAA